MWFLQKKKKNSLDIKKTLAEGKPFSGYLLYKLVVGPSTEVGAFTRGAMQTPHTKKYQLRANIYQGRGLSAAGIDCRILA